MTTTSLSESAIQVLLAHIDIVKVIGEYVPLNNRGRGYYAACPFCPRTVIRCPTCNKPGYRQKPSEMIVNPERQMFHCFACGEGGDALSFLVKHKRLTFPKALELFHRRKRWLRKQPETAGIGVAIDALLKRCLSAEAVQRAKGVDALVKRLSQIENPIICAEAIKAASLRACLTHQSLLSAVARQRKLDKPPD